MESHDGRVVWSLFSGAMGLDLGLEAAGLAPSLAVEIDPACAATMRANPERRLTFLAEDIRTLSGDDLRRAAGFDGDVWLVVGGPPCQAFSPGGNREGLKDPRGNLLLEYFRVIRDVRPRYFVLENVANLVSAALSHRPISERPGKKWSLKAYEKDRSLGGAEGAPLTDEEMAGSALRFLLREIEPLGYRITFGVLDAADHGAPQHRLRFVMVGAREGAPPSLPKPTHGDAGSGLPPRATVRDAIWDLQADPGKHYNYTPEFERLFALVPPGGYWKDLPPELHPVALGNAYASGGGKTGFFRRLAWDSPAPTVTGKPNRKGAAMCHPEAIRPLSVRECARLQGFPDDWRIVGTTEAQYRQIGNAVPVHLGRALGTALLTNPEARGDELDVETMLQRAITRMRSAGRNKKSRKGAQQALDFGGSDAA